MNKVFIIILSTVSIIGCNHPTDSHTTADSTAIYFDSTKTIISATVSSTRDQLQGLWQSADDGKNFLLFEDDHRKEYYEGMKDVDDAIFVLSDKCLNESDKNTETDKETDRYISCIDDDMCWYIVSVDSETLTLSYVSRGNTLVYRRAKKEDVR